MRTSSTIIDQALSGQATRSLCRKNCYKKIYNTIDGSITYRFEDGSGIMMHKNDTYEECSTIEHRVDEFI